MSGAWIFVTLVVLVCAQAIWRGRGPERLAAAGMLAGTAATILSNAEKALPFRSVEWQLLWVDVAVLGTFVAIALYANRFWPLWLAALQCLAVAAHAARGFDPQILPVAYWWLLGKLSYPMILVLCAGIERHHRRKRRGLPDQDWTGRPAPGDVREGDATVAARAAGPPASKGSLSE